MTNEDWRAIAVIVVGIGIAVGVHDYKSPYNQCVRAQEYINKNNKQIKFDFPEERARVQCAEAFGGKAD